ncbi:MAG TPA: AAA family ATPase [Nitriliruptoraceae bacterium]|nr:AAA family ATPase [Nitriliruptoraceae bacterium]
MLLEDRDETLGQLRDGLEVARSGHGRIAVVAGEAGVGKTALLRAFIEEVGDDGTVLVGACDDLLTPTPLAPLHEIGRRLGGPLADHLRDGATAERLHGSLVDALTRLPPPVVIALEDLHWADGATLDTVTVLARWVVDRPVLLVTTHRDDEVGPTHPLARVLARFPAPATQVVQPAALDRDAVARLVAAADSGLDPDELHGITGGNAFYVTEVLAGGELTTPPPSVAFAVTARLASLPDDTRELLELLSLVPGRSPIDLLDRLEPAWPTVLEPAEAVGMIQVGTEAVSFRHELARHAIADTLTTLRARSLHARILSALPDTVSAATVVHHAEGAGDLQMLVRSAVRAAADAIAAESYREALAHQERALAHPDHLEPDEAFDLWFHMARARLVSGSHVSENVAAAAQAVTLARDLDDSARLGRALASHSRLASQAGNHEVAAASGLEAVAVARPLGPSRALAEALAAMAYYDLATWDMRSASTRAAEAREVARLAGVADVEVLAGMFEAVPVVAVTGDLAPLEQAERAALEVGNRWAVAEGLMLASTALQFRRAHADTVRAADRALHFLGANDLSAGWGPYVHAIRARSLIATGRWDEAATGLDDALLGVAVSGWPRAALLATRGRLWARRGDERAGDELDEAWRIAAVSGSFQLRFVTATAIAEHAWLTDSMGQPPPALQAIEADTEGRRWAASRAEIAVWLDRAGVEDVGDGSRGALPHQLLLAGQFSEAARAWDSLDCVYEAAEARVLSDDPAQLLAALEVLDGLGAAPLARRARQRLRELGHRPPRGPQRRTRAHPLGLTTRQAEVLDLLATGATNAEIADDLVVSVRTVDNHVSAILRKLDVASREEAAAIAAATEEGPEPG